MSRLKQTTWGAISIKPSTKKKSPLREWVEALLGSVLLAGFIMIFIAQSFSVQGASMMPTLVNGQRLLVDKISYRFTDPSRGEIVVFKSPANPREEFIKRVIAVPGDRVSVANGKVFLNGQQIDEDYISAPARYGFPLQVVPDDHYFVLGDNRNNSMDSRDRRIGFIPREAIVGRGIVSYWPLDRLEVITPPEVF